MFLERGLKSAPGGPIIYCIVFGSSLLNGLKNKRLSNCTAYVIKFPGASALHMQIYAQLTLQEGITDTVIIHAGYNEVYDKNDVDHEIIQIAINCQAYSVKDITTSSLIYGSKSDLDSRVNCQQFSCGFIDDGNTDIAHVS